ncbi:glycosyltransferase [Candidatus Falkowbacteria bacterium]|uniref:Glycosyl transferase n=1 Tax=Candidatus Buchananbacteria bacterium CG10_big_fil_rev_8_21_14_0_10_33_19 TaxID=1974525 RepID=A0A2H0W7D1_9BACT|nr:glycosyltransferase [Candidatus Falkowbacteria bacterium]PIS06530.1 MAG: glycosyl transferase [Candidatus Buchananbacteria bacterium CG10_big_fil_rev_8_21_14_0_10_33_19]
MKILIALPAYNEEFILTDSVKKIIDFCFNNLVNDQFVIVIANNNSTDKTGQIADNLSLSYSNVEHLFIGQKGKGLAIASAWSKYDADLYCFMDADLATDLSALIIAIKQIKSGLDLVIGSRFHKQSQVTRSWQRKFISQCYRWFFKILFLLKINDFPCGFKVVTRNVRDSLLSEIENQEFFWDTELLVLANKQGFKILEIPVIWSAVDNNNRQSKVNIFSTSLNYLKQSILLKVRLLR